jgi:hypothetical protein
MASPRVYEGTLDEITTRYGDELRGRHLKVIVQETSPNTAEQPFYEKATPEEWSREWRAWAASHSHNTPLLSDEAVERESIYEGRGE